MEQPVYDWSTQKAIESTLAQGGMRRLPSPYLDGRNWQIEPANGSVGGLALDGRYSNDFTQDFSGGSWIKIRLQMRGHASMTFDGDKRSQGISGARMFLISHKDSLRKTQHFSNGSRERVITMRIACDAAGLFGPDVAEGAADRQDLAAKLGETETLRDLALPDILHRQADTILRGLDSRPAEVTQSRFMTLSEKCLDYVCRSVLGQHNVAELTAGRAKRIVDTALAIIENDLAAPPSLSVLCRQVGVNRNLLNVAFRQLTGETAFAALRGRRMEVARQMLLGSSLPVTEIAHLVGYSQLANFSAAYRQTFGIAPSREFERRGS